jgi:F-type H+-transporting ATPase subunit alpha
VELLKQDQRSSIPMWDQAILIYVFVNNLLSGIAIDEIRAFKSDFIKWVHQTHPQIPEDIRTTKVISEETATRLREVVAEYMQNKAIDDSLVKK